METKVITFKGTAYVRPCQRGVHFTAEDGSDAYLEDILCSVGVPESEEFSVEMMIMVKKP